MPHAVAMHPAAASVFAGAGSDVVAMRAGFDAAAAGRTLDDCPHQGETVERFSWMTGFNAWVVVWRGRAARGSAVAS